MQWAKISCRAPLLGIQVNKCQESANEKAGLVGSEATAGTR